VATPPTFQAEYEAAWDTTTTPKTVTPTTAAGDILAVFGGVEDFDLATLNTPTGNSLTYTQQQAVAVSGNWCAAHIWTAPDATGGAGWTLSDTRTAGVAVWGFNCLRFSGSDGVGASAKTNTTGAPSLDITTQADNSAIVVFVADWNAVDGATRTWRTVNGITPAAGDGEKTYFTNGINYTVYGAYYSDAGAAGVKTVGLSAPTGQEYSIVAVEIKGAAAGGAVAPTIGIRVRRGPAPHRGPLGRMDLLRAYHHRHRSTEITVTADIRNDTALGTVGLEADVTAKKVAVVTAISSLGLTATPVAKKVSKSTGVGTAGLASTVTAKKVSTPAALGAMGLSSNLTHADVRSVTVSAPLGLTATSTAKKVGRPTVSGPIGLAGTSTAKKVSRPVLSAPVGLAGIVTAQKKVIATGLGTLGLGSQHSGVTPRNVVALGGLGLTSTLAAKKRATPISAGVLGLTGSALPKKTSKSTGIGAVGLEPLATTGKKQAITGRSPLGLVAWWDHPPVSAVIAYVEVIGGSTGVLVGAGSTSGSVEAGSQGGTVGAASVGGSVEGGTTSAGQPA